MDFRQNKIIKPIYSDTPDYFHYYFNLVQGNELIGALQVSQNNTLGLLSSIPFDKENLRYAEGKWTVKEVLKHIIDCERIYSNSALSLSRFESTELPRFDKMEYIMQYRHVESSLEQLLNEYINLRQSTIDLFMPMALPMLDFKGVANNQTITARALGFMIAGHNIHHSNIISTLYLHNQDESPNNDRSTSF